MVLSGYNASKRTANGNYYYPYWFAVMPVIVVYTLVEGLRYGRAADYFTYLDAFTGLDVLYSEPLFLLFTDAINYLNAPFYFGFLISSFLLIFSGCFLVKRIRFIALYAIPLFYLATIVQSENLVRMYFAFSLFFISIAFLLDRKPKKLYLYLCLAFLTHYSIIFLIPFLILFLKFKNPFKNIYIILGIYLTFNLVQLSQGFIISVITLFDGLGLYQEYISNNKNWTIDDTIDSSLGVVYYLRLYILPIIILILGYGLLKKYEPLKLHLFYHLYFVGIILLPTSSILTTEILNRICIYFISFSFLVCAIICYEKIRNWNRINLLSQLATLILIIDALYLIIKRAFIYDNILGNLFVWDIQF